MYSDFLKSIFRKIIKIERYVCINMMLLQVKGNILNRDTLIDILVDLVDSPFSFIINFLVFNIIVLPFIIL